MAIEVVLSMRSAVEVTLVPRSYQRLHQISQQQQVCHLRLICDGAYNPPLDEAQYSCHVLQTRSDDSPNKTWVKTCIPISYGSKLVEEAQMVGVLRVATDLLHRIVPSCVYTENQ